MRLSTLGIGALAGWLACSWLLGCGGSKGAPSGPGDDATDASSDGSSSGGSSGGLPGDGGGSDAGSTPDGYPAFTPEMPTIQNGKGPVLSAPKIVTVTWADDPNAAAVQAFDDGLGASSYWQVLDEYGVGPATSTSADHVVVQTPLMAGIDTDAIDGWVQAQIAAAPGNGWPAPDPQTVYAVYVPASVNATYGGDDACLYGDGYHIELDSPTNADGVSYAQILEGCYLDDGLPLLTDMEETGSHELAEATTDPFPNNGPAFYGFDEDHIAWELWDDWQDEIADACEYFDEGYYQGGTAFPYWLSRLWSNASAKAGHDPCVPAPSGAYNNVSPLGLQAISVSAVDVDGTVSTFSTKGWRIAPGATATVKVGFYSDAPTGTWSVQAVEGDCCTSPWESVLTVTPNVFSGKNGDSVDLTIKVDKAPSQGTAALLTFFSAAGGKTNHYMPVIVGTY